MAEDFGVPGPEKIGYYGQVAESTAGRDYKRELLAALDLHPGQTVLDAGCGPGTDLAAMAALVADTGTVIGVDLDPAMVAEACRRTAGTPTIEVRHGDAHALPVDTASVDRVRADRMVQHVADPAGVFAEFHRVLRPGGLACVAEPDWDTLVVDPGDLATTRAFNRFVCDTMVRNATAGRRLAGLAERAGLRVLAVRPTAPVFRDFAVADKILGLSRNAERAVRGGHLDRDAADRWISGMRDGPFLATSLLFTVVAAKPGG
ncbi:MAG: methyltransferase domain-containing protein [Mycobacteriales bacterium]